MIDVLHLHGFKCAGTTFASILQENFGPRVAYVESQDGGERLPWQAVPGAVRLAGLRAISSHLVTMPLRGLGFAMLNVAFVRDPGERIKSAYRFQRRTGALKPSQQTFSDYVQGMRRSVLSNYQTRHLSPQDDGGWEQRRGWQLRPELIDLARPDLFVGVVERFDESLVLLERRLTSLGLPFRGEYASALNVEADEPDRLEGIPLELVEVDEVLHMRANAQLDKEIQGIPDFQDLLGNYRLRCATRREQGPAAKVPGPAEWTYVERADLPHPFGAF